MKRKIVYIALIVFCFLVRSSYAQYFPEINNTFQKLTIESGLSQNKINCILRDKTGYVWIGTGNGLSRFDGTNVLILEKRFGDQYNLRNMEIFDLHEDSDGSIWIAADKGLFKYNPELEEVKDFLLARGILSQLNVYSLATDRDSLLWLGTNDGLKLFDKEAGIIVKEYGNIPYEPYTLSNDAVLAVCCLNNDVWIGTANGLNKLGRNEESFKRYFYDLNNPNSIGSNVIRKIIADENGTIWIGTESGGLSMYDKERDCFVNYNTGNSGIPHNDIRDIFNLGDGKMWLGTNGGGLSLFDTENLSFSTQQHDPLNATSLTNNSVYVVYEDYDKILWLGFYAGGVNFDVAAINDFNTISHLPGNDFSLCENNVRSLSIDSKQNLWAGTFGGLSFYDSQKQVFKNFVNDPDDSFSLSFNTVTSILEDSKGRIWVGTYSGGVNQFVKNRFIHHRHNKRNESTLSGDNVYVIKESPQGRIWVATASGLHYYSEENNGWNRVLVYNIRDFVFLDNGGICLATINGLIIYSPESGTFELFDDERLHGSLVVSLYYESGSDIWFGTQGEGFGSFNVEEKKYNLYDTKDGLPSNFVASIEKSGEDQFWLSTYSGLSLFNAKTQEFVNYGLAEGVPFLEFYPRSSVCLPDSSLAFGGADGIVVFNPKKLMSSIRGSKLRFNSFKIDGNDVVIGEASPLKKSIGSTREIELKYSQNDFSLGFNDINFKSRGLGQYAYKLENYMSEWNNIGNQTNIGFTNMDPGEYVLKVRKLGGDPIRGYQDEIQMKIKIIPPFWMTWYFYCLVVAVIIGIMYLYKKYTLISINQQNEIRLQNLEYEKHEEFNRLRMNFFTYISHELRTPLSLIVDPLNHLLKNNRDNENYRYIRLIENNSERIMRLVNQILDFRKLESDAINLQVGCMNVKAEVYKIFASFEHIAQSEHINYTFNSMLEDEFEGWIDSDKLEKIMYNLISNALKFTRENGEVIIGLNRNETGDTVQISISDSGFGIKPEKLQRIFEYFYSDETEARSYKAGVGIGLNYVKRLVDLHHGTITVESEMEKGSVFTITLPVRKEEYSRDEIRDTITNVSLPVSKKISSPKPLPENTILLKHSENVPLILVVEDESELRNYIASQLSSKFRVLQAINGKDALEKMRQDIPDLILSDNVMPVMDGIEFCNSLKSNNSYHHIPFLFLSAWNSDDFKMRGLKEGAEDYLSKPFNYEILEAKICNIIQKRRLLLEVAGQIVKVNPSKIKIETTDEKFILKAQDVIEKNIDNPDFTTKNFEDELNMSHSVVYRKLKTLTGLSANEFIREFKIRRAAQFIEQDNNLTVLDVSLMVGFNDQKYFSRCFKKVIGVSPSEYSLRTD